MSVRVTIARTAPLRVRRGGNRRTRHGTRWIVLAALALTPAGARAQTFQPVPAINIRECGTFLGITSCETIKTNRITRNFTNAKLESPTFKSLAGTASHCNRVDATQAKCAASVTVWTDPDWHRIVWSVSNKTVRAYGRWGGRDDGPGRFMAPAGVAITRGSGEWHVAFIADQMMDRVAVLMIGRNCLCVQWLGEITGIESGRALKGPRDVAWDPAESYMLSDDRLFIADTENGRVVVYRINIDPASASFSASYLGAFKSDMLGSGQLERPVSVTVMGVGGQQGSDVLVADEATNRVSRWTYGPYGSLSAMRRDISNVLPGTLTAVTLDHEQDVIAATNEDPTRGEFVKLNGTSLATTLARFGRTSGWGNGDYARLFDAEVVPAYTPAADGYTMALERLPYVGVAETWGDTTGAQLIRLGTSVVQPYALQSGAGGGEVLRFTVTGTTKYRVDVYDQYSLPHRATAAPVRPIASNVVTRPGIVEQEWDGRDSGGTYMPSGRYYFVIRYESAYSYDDGVPQEVIVGFDFVQVAGPGGGGDSPPEPMTVAIMGPDVAPMNYEEYWASSVTYAPPGTILSTIAWYRAEYETQDQWQLVANSDLYGGSLTSECGFLLKLVITTSDGQSAEDLHAVQGPNASSYGCNPFTLTANLTVAASDVPEAFFASQRMASALAPAGLRQATGGGLGVGGALMDVTSGGSSVQRDGVRGIAFGVPRPTLVRRKAGASPQPKHDTADVTPVSVDIRDHSGRLLRRAFEGTLRAGYYEYVWDGARAGGARMPPGVYMASVRVGSHVRNVKLVLVD